MTKIQYIKKTALAFFAIGLLLGNTSFGQGPTAPEAASFEPVDATDMVNLATGDFTYVLPLLNVPSPEGGYPIALAYHAGIAMDQEASWTGLGWNLNPGAINRSVNGYPDDYNHSLLSEYFYDKGGKEYVYSISANYSNIGSVGLGLSWGSNRSLTGQVSLGTGFNFGGGSLSASITARTNGTGSGSVGLSTASGLSFGISGSNDGITGFAGISTKNGTGFNISSNGTFKASLGYEGDKEGDNPDNRASVGFTLSSKGLEGISGSVGSNSVSGSFGIGVNCF